MGVIVETSKGSVEGVQRGSHQAFLGVPFAKPPVGGLRWRAPEPAEPWEGVRDASAFGNAAAQPDHPIPGFAASGTRSEDCLYLNVYAPAADGGSRPVMLWIHGGGFTHGTGSEPLYNGGPLAERGDVVVVTINYRLGALGYLYLGAHGGDEWGATANAGQLDQVAALQWVQDEISSFGGDAGNVTIFGQSAGAGAVSALLAMPAAQGLFHKAIMESGGGGDADSVQGASASAELLLEELGLEEPDESALLALSTDSILAAQAELTGRARFRPVVDGSVVPETTATVAARGGLASIPVMLGTNRDEMKQFRAMQVREPLEDVGLLDEVRAAMPAGKDGEAERVIEVIRESRSSRGLPSDNRDVSDVVATQPMRVASAHLAELQGAHQAKTFHYFFEWESPARRGALGSCHSLEMPFVFGTLDAPTQDRFAGTGPEAELLSEQMMDAWLSFARSGDPSHEGIGVWPMYDASRRGTMVFGPQTRVEDAPFEEERALYGEVVYS